MSLTLTVLVVISLLCYCFTVDTKKVKHNIVT